MTGSFVLPTRVLLAITTNLSPEDKRDRPPIVGEMMGEIIGMANKTAHGRTYSSCVMLSHEDIVGDCMHKLSRAISSGKIRKIPNKEEAFSYIKTIFNNQARSMVSRHIKTAKRGYDKNSENDPNVVGRYNDVSIHDEESGVQIRDHNASIPGCDTFLEDNSKYFSATQQLILREFAEPSETSFLLAYMDAADAGSKKIIIKDKHRAEALGLSNKEFRCLLDSIRNKITEIKKMEADRNTPLYNQAIGRLEEKFGIHIPGALPTIKVRRLLTIAARDQYQKLDKPSLDDLRTVGARLPELRPDERLACFAVLYAKNDRTCQVCSLRNSCMVEAANVGLGNITISQRLLGARQTRIPSIIVGDDNDGSLVTGKDEGIYSHLHHVCDRYEANKKEFQFKHRDVEGSRSVIFAVSVKPKFRLQFVNPSENLKGLLIEENGLHYPSHDASTESVIDMIDQHVNEVYENYIESLDLSEA
jgi:hypothetical protein